MKKKWLLFVLAFVLSGSVSSSAVACNKDKDCKFGKPSDISGKSLIGNSLPCPCFLLKKSEELKLTGKQQADLKAIKLEMKKEKIANYAQVKILKLDLQNLLEQEPVDTRKADTYIDQIAQYLTTTAKDCIVARVRAKRILTAAQFKQAKKLAERCAKKPDCSGYHKQYRTDKKICDNKGKGGADIGGVVAYKAQKAKCGSLKKSGSSLFLQPGDLTN